MEGTDVPMHHILVVDDSSDSREPLVRLLRLQGHGVSSASDGYEALQAVSQHPPDLILLDVMMPHMDGVTFLKHLRSDPALKDLPVILVTAATDERLIHECSRLGIKGCLTKSRFSFSQLLSRVSEELAHHPKAQSPTWHA
jgi:adenylate cyclase